MMKQLRTLPVSIDAAAIAEGMMEMFTEEQKTVLRFGMLPAENMEILQKEFDARFRRMMNNPQSKEDKLLAILEKPHARCVEFSMKKLVAEAVHEVTLEILKIGDLVV